MTGDQPPEWAPPDSQYEFHDGELNFRVGEIYGLRSFSINSDGWLTGVMFHKPWTPGVNEAQCWRVTSWESEGLTSTESPYLTTVSEPNPDDPDHPIKSTAYVMRGAEGERWNVRTKPTPIYGNNDDPTHVVGDDEACGLHGYLEGSLDYGSGNQKINGVVKAWGRMALGDRGFRAQYARIVALYAPLTPAADVGPGFTYRPQPPTYWGMLSSADPGVPTQEQVDLIRERYKVPVFNSLRKMLEAFPTTPPEKRKAPDET